MDSTAAIHVVHVDDNAAFASMTAEQLERVDPRLEVTTVQHVDDALELLAEGSVDGVISDYEMPTMDGLEFLETVRSEYGDIPFVLFTGAGSETVASEAIARGVTDYVQKGGGSNQYEVLANRVISAVSRRRAESNYREIFEKATDGIAVHDPETGAIVDVNERFAEMMGYDRETLLSKDMQDVLIDEEPYTVEAARERVRQVSTGASQVFEWRAETRTGEQFPVEVNLKAAVIGGQDRVLAFVRDITDRKDHERALAALHETAQELMACETAQGVYNLVIETAHDLLPCEYAIADAVRSEELVPRAEAPGEVQEGAEHAVPLDGEQNVASRAYLRGETVVVDDLHGPDGVDSKTPYHAVISVPIGDHGVFQAASREVGIFSKEDRELAELLVNHATAALDRLESVAAQQVERERLAGLFENLPSAIVEYEMVGGQPVIRGVNPAFESVFGYDAATVQGQPLDEFVVPQTETEQAAVLNDQVAAGDRLNVEVRRETVDGVRTFQLVNAPIESVDDEPQRGYAIYRDITEREEASRRLEAVIERAEQAIYIKDRDGRYELVNDACAEMFDMTPEAMEGQTDRDIFPEEEAARIKGIDEQVIRDQEGTTYERTVEVGDEYRVLHNQKYPYIDATGAVAGVIGISTDVTERREREQRLDALTSAFPDIAMIVDEDGRHVEVLASSASEDLLYLDPEDIVGKRLDELFDKDRASTFEDLIDRTLATGELQTMEYQLEVQKGTRWFEARTTPLATKVGGKPAVAWVSRDITDRKRREEELQRQRDRLDEFANVVSHDLRTPLNLATGHLEMAREEVDNEHLGTVADAHQRMEALVQTLLEVAKGEVEEADTEQVSLPTFVEECWTAIDPGEATLEVETDGVVLADPTRFRQLFENLFRNSLEHGGETVTVRVGNLPTGFYVEDDGPGIPTEDRAKIFESGFSGEESGTGFGLSIVAQVVDDHGWSVRVTESASGGARFEFTDIQTVG